MRTRKNKKGAHGDWLVVSDRSGFVDWASNHRKEWNGALVHEHEWEPRNEQDFVRGIRDDLKVDPARPRPVDTYIGALSTTITQDSAAGSVDIYVLHTDRMQRGDSVLFYLSNGDAFRTTIAQLVSATQITISNLLTNGVSAGVNLIDLSAVAPAKIS